MSKETEAEAAVEELFLKMRERSSFMIDLAYSALLYDNIDIAKEVDILEEEMDEMCDDALWLSLTMPEEKGFAMIKLAIVVEELADGAREMADIVLRDVDIHPILEMSIRDSDEIITRVSVENGSLLSNRKLEELELETRTGMSVLAIRKGRKWIFDPDEKERIDPGDVMILKGPLEGEKGIISMAKAENNR